MAKIQIDPSFAKITRGKTKLTVSAQTLRDSLVELEKQFPGLNKVLLDSEGNLINFVMIYVDKEDVRYSTGLETKLRDDSEILIIKAVAGG